MYVNEALSFPVAGRDAAQHAGAVADLEIPGQLLGAREVNRERRRASIDTVLAAVALASALTLTNPTLGGRTLGEVMSLQVPVQDLLVSLVFFGLWPRIFSLSGVYLAPRAAARSEIFSVLVACTVGSMVATSFVLFGSTSLFSLRTIGIFWALSILVTLGFRGFARAVNTSIRTRSPRKVLIVGSGARALKLSHDVSLDPDVYELIGFVDDSHQWAAKEVTKRMLGGLEELEKILMLQVVDEVLIALPIKSCYSQIQAAIQTCERMGVESKYLADVFQCSVAKPRMENHRSRPVMSMKVAHDDYRVVLKRVFDFVAAFAGLVVLLPVLLAIAIGIKVTSAGPVIFAQERYGRNKRRFKMYKFRTMVPDAEVLQAALESQNEAVGPVFKIREDPRVTRIGRFLRRSSLDELPQLFNVLLGDMSLVGPRPLPARDVQLFDQGWFMRRFSVAPGLTCLWQISGRSNLGFDDWVALDLKYIDEWSLGLDLQILARTIPAVVRGVGAA